MSDDYLNVKAIIKGFNLISTDTNQEHQNPASPITLRTLFNIIEVLRNRIQSDKITEIENRLNEHISNTDNPHEVDMSDLFNSIGYELYKVWLNQENRGTYDRFLSIIFQDVAVAEEADLDEGTSTVAVPTVAGTNYLINLHNDDPDAHPNLIEGIYKGTPPLTFPLFSIIPELGIEGIYESDIARIGNQTYFDFDKTAKEMDDDELKADYFFTEPAFYLGGSFCTNYKTHTSDFGTTQNAILNNITIGETTIYKDSFGNSSYGAVYEVNDAVVHHMQFTDFVIGPTEIGTFTIDAVANYRNLIYIATTVPGSKGTAPSYAVYNLETGEITLSADTTYIVNARMYTLPSGHKRLFFMVNNSDIAGNKTIYVGLLDSLESLTTGQYDSGSAGTAALFLCCPTFIKNHRIVPTIPTGIGTETLAPINWKYVLPIKLNNSNPFFIRLRAFISKYEDRSIMLFKDANLNKRIELVVLSGVLYFNLYNDEGTTVVGGPGIAIPEDTLEIDTIFAYEYAHNATLGTDGRFVLYKKDGISYGTATSFQPNDIERIDVSTEEGDDDIHPDIYIKEFEIYQEEMSEEIATFMFNY